jgi:SAM-dependent methyltransferase
VGVRPGRAGVGHNEWVLRDVWDANAGDWIAWSRAPGHDSYWRFHRDAFLSLVPPPGRLTLDVGCGEGRVSRDLARLGHKVVGDDGSRSMAAAAATHPEPGGPVVVGDAALLPFPDSVADCVVMFMSLQDIDDMEAAIAEAARVLVAGGRLLIAITHPVNTAGSFEESSDGSPRPFVIRDSWFERSPRADTCERGGLTMAFHSEHRPLQAYTDALADSGFLIERIKEVTEPDPDDKWHRMPLFLHLRAVMA